MAAEPARAILLNDTEAWYHWGCTATSLGLKGLISRRYQLVDSIPIDAIYALAERPQGPAQFPDPAFFAAHCKANATLYQRIAAADVVFVNGEGTIHGISQQAATLLYLAWSARIRLGKPVYLVNHSVYPDDGPEIRRPEIGRFYARVYRDFDHVAIREVASLRLMRGLGVAAQLTFDCLPLTLRDWTAPDLARREAVVVAGAAEFPEAALAPLAAYLREQAARGRAVEVITGARAKPARDEAAFVRRLAAVWPAEGEGGWTHRDCASLSDWLWAIGSARLLVSGRFHHSLAAFALGTPFVAFASNTPKLEGVCEMLELPPPLSLDRADLTTAIATRAAEVTEPDFAARAAAPRTRELVWELAEHNLPPETAPVAMAP